MTDTGNVETVEENPTLANSLKDVRSRMEVSLQGKADVSTDKIIAALLINNNRFGWAYGWAVEKLQEGIKTQEE